MIQIDKKKESGFGTVELILVIVVAVVVALAAMIVYSHHEKSNSSANSISNNKTARQSSQSAITENIDPTAKWVRTDSIGGAYSIKIPDGWGLTNYPGNTLIGDDLTFTAGKQATITTASNAYAGDQKEFNIIFTDKQYSAPQWQSPNQFGKETSTDFAIGNAKGMKYSIQYTQTATGVTKGEKIYQ